MVILKKTGQGFSVKTGQNTGQNFRALQWMPSEVPFAKDKSIAVKLLKSFGRAVKAGQRW